MNRIFFIHGKNPKPLPMLHEQQLLRCLLHGVARADADAAAAIAAVASFRLIAWSDLFYDTRHDISEDLPWIERLLRQEGQHEQDVHDSRPAKYRIAQAMYTLGDHLPWLLPLIPDARVKASIRETENYFMNHGNLGCRIREVLKHPLREAAWDGDRVLLIAHSMGSVIAYDALWELDHLEGFRHCVDCLLSIGSPLGMHYVQRRLIGLGDSRSRSYPTNIRRWANIAARGDLVALDPTLGDDFGAMVDAGDTESITDMYHGIYNSYRDARGLNVHKSFGYLVNPAVGQVVADWWNGD